MLKENLSSVSHSFPDSKDRISSGLRHLPKPWIITVSSLNSFNPLTFYNAAELFYVIKNNASFIYLSINTYQYYFNLCSNAVKRHHGKGTSCKGKHFNKTCLQFLRFTPLSSQLGAWRHAGTRVAGEAEESFTSRSPGSWKRETLSLV